MITISLQGVLQLLGIVLVVIAIVAVAMLIRVLKNVAEMTDAIGKVVKDHTDDLDTTIASIPEITHSAQNSIRQVNSILDRSSDDIVDSLKEVKSTLVNATRMTTDVADTVEYVGSAAVDTADFISSGVNRGNSTLSYIRQIAQVVRDVLNK